MPLTGLIATTDAAAEARYRAQGRRAPPERQPKPEALGPPAPAAEDADRVYDPAFFGARFVSDLSRLKAFDEEPGQAADTASAAFFGHLGALLAAVRASDIVGAQAAADALEREARAAQGESGRPGPLLDELSALVGPEPPREESASRLMDFAQELQNALAPPTPGRDPYAEIDNEDDDGGAYDASTPYFDGDVNAV